MEGSEARCISLGHRAKGYRIARLVDRRNAMLPDVPGFSRHDIERARLGIQGEPLPFLANLAAETEFAGGPERQSEYFLEMRLVPVPPDAGACVVLGAKDLHYSRAHSPVGFDFLNHGRKPCRWFVRFLKPLQRVVIFEAEGCDTPLAFERAELEWDQGESAYPFDKIVLY
jgi:hypothetical protein